MKGEHDDIFGSWMFKSILKKMKMLLISNGFVPIEDHDRRQVL